MRINAHVCGKPFGLVLALAHVYARMRRYMRMHMVARSRARGSRVRMFPREQVHVHMRACERITYACMRVCVYACMRVCVYATCVRITYAR
jgi:hypothetical protein